MASPLFDSLNLQHSRNIGDAVAAAATDGQAFTSAQRTAHLNAGIRRWMEDQILSESFNGLSSYVVESPAISLSGNVISLESASFTGGKVMCVLSVKNNTNPSLIRKIPIGMKHFVDNAYSNSFLSASVTSQYWTVDGGNIRVIGSGATDSISVVYIIRHVDLGVGGSTDIVIPSTYWNMILDYALVEALKEKPQTQEIVTRLKLVSDILNQQLQKLAANKIVKNG